MSITSVLRALADYLDLQPSRPVDMVRVRVRARRLGLTTDWVGLLPNPGDAHQSAYAIRLRSIAGGERQ